VVQLERSEQMLDFGCLDQALVGLEDGLNAWQRTQLQKLLAYVPQPMRVALFTKDKIGFDKAIGHGRIPTDNKNRFFAFDWRYPSGALISQAHLLASPNLCEQISQNIFGVDSLQASSSVESFLDASVLPGQLFIVYMSRGHFEQNLQLVTELRKSVPHAHIVGVGCTCIKNKLLTVRPEGVELKKPMVFSQVIICLACGAQEAMGDIYQEISNVI